MTTHLLIAGHGRKRNDVFDPGAMGFIQKGEHRYFKEDLFPAMKNFLPASHNIIFFDEYNVYDHGNIVDLAKRYNADEVTEFHFDAASPSASGGHVIVYSGYAPDETDLALRDVIDDMVGVRYSHRNHKGVSGRNNLANVNLTAKVGITYRLLELGFGTNINDAKIMTENVEEYAKKLVEVFVGESNSKSPKKQSSAPTRQTKPTSTNKTVSQMASEVIAGQHGSGHTNRRQSLGVSQSIYEQVRSEVNRRAGVTTSSSRPQKSISQMAQEVIDGKHGNGHSARRNSLGISQSQYDKVRAEVNKRAGSGSTNTGKSISQMATEVIRGDHGTGHSARRRSLGISQSRYEQVRAEVNRRL